MNHQPVNPGVGVERVEIHLGSEKLTEKWMHRLASVGCEIQETVGFRVGDQIACVRACQ